MSMFSKFKRAAKAAISALGFAVKESVGPVTAAVASNFVAIASTNYAQAIAAHEGPADENGNPYQIPSEYIGFGQTFTAVTSTLVGMQIANRKSESTARLNKGGDVLRTVGAGIIGATVGVGVTIGVDKLWGLPESLSVNEDLQQVTGSQFSATIPALATAYAFKGLTKLLGSLGTFRADPEPIGEEPLLGNVQRTDYGAVDSNNILLDM